MAVNKFFAKNTKFRFSFEQIVSLQCDLRTVCSDGKVPRRRTARVKHALDLIT
jgi:hypothetical protein